mmetsp:Transcript_25055/g.41067  ORF Transcript_25055/g.41067 Transcript_25055/m.41067 type:complete len:247 (+) Transcript_25055:299-1039(+)
MLKGRQQLSNCSRTDNLTMTNTTTASSSSSDLPPEYWSLLVKLQDLDDDIDELFFDTACDETTKRERACELTDKLNALDMSQAPCLSGMHQILIQSLLPYTTLPSGTPVTNTVTNTHTVSASTSSSTTITITASTTASTPISSSLSSVGNRNKSWLQKSWSGSKRWMMGLRRRRWQQGSMTTKEQRRWKFFEIRRCRRQMYDDTATVATTANDDDDDDDDISMEIEEEEEEGMEIDEDFMDWESTT